MEKNPSKLKQLILKYEELFLYGFYGGATTLINWSTYTVLQHWLSITASNIIAWTVAVIFAFYVNKRFVFKSRHTDAKIVFKEALTFLSGRLASGVIEMSGPPLLVLLGVDGEVLGIKGSVAKLIVSVFVIIFNYFYGKLIVFRKKHTHSEKAERSDGDT